MIKTIVTSVNIYVIKIEQKIIQNNKQWKIHFWKYSNQIRIKFRKK